MFITIGLVEINVLISREFSKFIGNMKLYLFTFFKFSAHLFVKKLYGKFNIFTFELKLFSLILI